MRISHSWLKRYVDIRLTPRALADDLSMLGLEVERFEEQAETFKGFVVGEVLERKSHPNADRLSVCKIHVGKEIRQIVCGAPNVAAGQKVAVGLIGARVPQNQHDPSGAPFILQKIAIRGVESQGMICSEYELGLGTDKDGIMLLEANARVGMPLATYLRKTDVVYEIEVTANRGDWLSHWGVAREISAMTGKPLSFPSVHMKESKTRVAPHARVKIIDSAKCPRYVARVIRNVVVKPSPVWMQDLLEACGVRPVNNIVDITNFVMLETGQPLHAFDYDKIEGHAITVRCAEKGQKFTTLDGKSRTLDDQTLLICDENGPVAIGGVMGGINSEITDSTKNVLLESACFDAGNIRRTAKALGMSTEASQRFERSVDQTMTLTAVHRAAQLFAEFADGEVLRGVIDVYPHKKKAGRIRIRAERTNRILGTHLSSREILGYLKRLGIEARAAGSGIINAVIPTHRHDLIEEIDLIEEVARLYGYNNIETRMNSKVRFPEVLERESLSDMLRSHLIGAGFNEIVTNSLQKNTHARLAGDTSVEVLNPVSVDMEMLRPSLIPGALDVVRRNLNHGKKSVCLFELGRVYKRLSEKPPVSLDQIKEEQRLLIVLGGEFQPQHYSLPLRQYDILDLKGEVEGLLFKFFLDKHRLIYYDNHKPLSVDNIDIEIQGTYRGFLGRLAKEIAEAFDIKNDLFLCELSLEGLISQSFLERRFTELPRFPSVARDLAFVVDRDLPQIKVDETIRQAGGQLLVSLKLFDMFLGDQVGAGKKSLAYALELQSIDHTLTDREANEVIALIVQQVATACGATLRS